MWKRAEWTRGNHKELGDGGLQQSGCPGDTAKRMCLVLNWLLGKREDRITLAFCLEQQIGLTE